MSEIQPDIGAAIRALRKRKGFSLNLLAEKTGIAASNLSSIELNKTSPTLHTLVRIASAFDLKVGQFLDQVVYRKAVIYKGDSKPDDPATPAAVTETILGGGPTDSIEARVTKLTPSRATVSLGRLDRDMLIYCIEGRASIQVSDEAFGLQPKDALLVYAGNELVLKTGPDEGASLLVVSAS